MDGDEGLSRRSFGKVFDQLCPYYMSIGMPYDEFWNGDVSAVVAYRKAEELNEKRRNFSYWLQGLYFRDALNSTVGNMLSGKKGQRIDYPQEPYPTTAKQKEETEEQKRKTMEERLKAAFGAFAFNAAQRMRQNE